MIPYKGQSWIIWPAFSSTNKCGHIWYFYCTDRSSWKGNYLHLWVKRTEDLLVDWNNLISKCNVVTQPRQAAKSQERSSHSNSLTSSQQVSRCVRDTVQNLVHTNVFLLPDVSLKGLNTMGWSKTPVCRTAACVELKITQTPFWQSWNEKLGNWLVNYHLYINNIEHLL